ncbi:hypothetical protein SORBI_3007G217200 [Sorghum bicolor]|uniref:Caffeoyl-CoA O-methyltransferase n=1 Tax=Sorghum bicolor TaxID=4558 RepID=C5YJ84_SORBI|nr:hypothetical protein SORBI_3007G217200 [Sorghum bicolor]
MFTGYSLLATALALPDDGKVIAVDVSREYYDVGRPFIERAGVTGKVEFRGHRALEHLDALLADEGSTWTCWEHLDALLADEGNVGAFDFVFVDADKPNYHEQLLRLVRVSGESSYLNAMLAADERVDVCQLTIGDGVTICRRLV